MPTPKRQRIRRLLFWSTILAAMLVSVLIAMRLAGDQTRQRQAQGMSSELRTRGQSLRYLIDRYRVLPTVLALDPELRAALANPSPDSEQLHRLNLKLEQANGATHVSTLTLLDRTGLALAANNWREPANNVNEQYGFRPYFQNAMRDGTGEFYGVGVSTGLPGYFISEAIRDTRGQPIGVIVVKISLDALRLEWATSPDTLLVSDEHGIVFLSNVPQWEYRQLRALSTADQADLAASRQYSDQPLLPTRTRIMDTLDDGTERLQIRQPALSGTWLAQSQMLPPTPWRLHILHRDRSGGTAMVAAAATLAVWLALIPLILLLRQRWQLAQRRKRGSGEFQRMVAHHAGTLDAAEDPLVEAARKAAAGQDNANLEHLVQGVSVVDADMRLVAWNSRYREIFGFPDELLQAGRPIEDLFRYNAQRGWLGPGSIDEAIGRRLNHLRSGGAHMHERELPNGMVLEIYGNPLPDGGFVTSFADITSYKSAARDLRTLVSSLERRIEDSTQDLREAKAAAEDANRYKARFVAAAVHDLLQPVNAARMFLSALRDHIAAPKALEMIDRIESTFGAQDDLLTSLLDISRLDTGALQPRITTIALAPLLTGLAEQFDLPARAQGLELRWVPAHCNVRTDPSLLRRILQNFLSNAIHYTPKGKVLLGCRRRPGAVSIEVWDTGVGIPESQYAKVLEEFQRLDNGIQRDMRSAGLGLSIVERSTRLLGHPFRMRSWHGRGSVFSVEVPLSSQEPDPPAAVATSEPSSLQGVEIWQIDDDPQTLAGARMLLEGWGCVVRDAYDRASALTLAQQHPPPRLILLDYHLGGSLTGPDVLKDMVSSWTHTPPVVIVSAHRDEALRKRIAELGFGFLSKPVAPSALRALITHLLLAGNTSDEARNGA